MLRVFWTVLCVSPCAGALSAAVILCAGALSAADSLDDIKICPQYIIVVIQDILYQYI